MGVVKYEDMIFLSQLNKVTQTIRGKYDNRPWYRWPDLFATANNLLYGNDKRELLLERVAGPKYF
jgi:hypothetical protein